MKILIYDVDCKSSGVTYPLKDSFEAVGHQATMFDWRQYLYAYNDSGIISRIKDKILFNLLAKRINLGFINEIKNNKYDLLLVVRGDHVFPESIEEAKKHIPFVVNWSSDDVFNPLNSTKYMLDCFDKYDCIFSPREHLREEYLSKGAKSFEVLNWYYRAGLIMSSPKGNQVKSDDISFIGAWSERRENILNSISTHNMKIRGWGWNKKAQKQFLAKTDCQAGVGMKDMMDIFATSKINVNILTIENRDTTNLRNYEIPAACGFQVSERSDAILQLFDEDKEIVCYGSNEELMEKCDYYLRNENERQKIAINGYYRIVNSSYSLIDRVKQILKIIPA